MLPDSFPSILVARLEARGFPCFNSNLLKLQYEWTLLQMFFCGYRVLQILCRNIEGAK